MDTINQPVQPVQQAQSKISESELKKIKEEIENEANPKNKSETIKLMDDNKLLVQTLQNASNNFKEKVGREMTYLEMREMMG